MKIVKYLKLGGIVTLMIIVSGYFVLLILASDSGALSPGTVIDSATVGTVAWINPDNAKVSDNSRAQTGVIENTEESNIVTENSIKIVKGGIIGGNEKSTGATLPTTDAYISYGSSSDLWGETWSYLDINDIDFGVVFSAKGNLISHYLKTTNFSFSIPTGATIDGILVEIEQVKSNFAQNDFALVDHIRITVYFSESEGYSQTRTANVIIFE